VPSFHSCASLSSERTDLCIIALGADQLAAGDAGSAATGRELQRDGSSGLSAAPSGSASTLLPGNSRELNDLRGYEDASHTTPVASESAGAFSTRIQLTWASIAGMFPRSHSGSLHLVTPGLWRQLDQCGVEKCPGH